MGAVSSRSMPRKSMRVATIFTGVAACTAGVTQVANAQDAAKHTSKHIGRAIRPAGRVSGSIRYVDECIQQGIDSTWLHLKMFNPGTQRWSSICFGYRGYYGSPPGIGVFSECGGNNHGWLSGYYSNGGYWDSKFGPGHAYRYLGKSELQGVTITSWTGHDSC